MISVLMPAYNAEEYIAEAIDSVVGQTYPHWELLVIDDGSTDSTQEIVSRYVDRDERVRLLEVPHGGISAARNAGLKAAKYPWAALLDADDVALPRRFELQIAASEEDPEVVLWASYSHDLGAQGQVGSLHKSGPTSRAEYEHHRSTGKTIVFRNSTILFRRDLALDIGGFDAAMEPGEDVDFWDRMAELGPTIALKDSLVQYRRHSGSITNQRLQKSIMIGDFVAARCRARARGESLDWETFQRAYNAIGPLGRALRYIDTTGRKYCRNAVTAHTERKRFRAASLLLAATVLSPRTMLTRIWKQKLSPS
ncbi:MAG: glycosyltransferase family 2 protein [Planctomycetota bacterium]|nr:MAG: glycosyltransferase family 2 protein [Planctomycetota bacterium]REK46609.1 MAG: glycosyltransferase family 2 protein [Planctomycetota bacterium]